MARDARFIVVSIALLLVLAGLGVLATSVIVVLTVLVVLVIGVLAVGLLGRSLAVAVIIVAALRMSRHRAGVVYLTYGAGSARRAVSTWRVEHGRSR